METKEQIFMIGSSVDRARGNRAINAAEDENYGEILKSGDNTLLKYKIFDGDGESLPLEGLPCEAVIKKEDKVVYRTPAEVDAENIVSFKITEVLPSDRNNPYTIEFIITQDQDTLIFPSDDRINLYIYPSSLSVDGEIIEKTPEARLNETVIVAVNYATQELTAQLAQKARQNQVDALETRVESVIQSADLDPNKDQEVVDARFGKPTLSAKIRDIDKVDSLFENTLFDTVKKRDYSGQTSTGSTTPGSTRVIHEEIPMGTLVLSLNMEVNAPGQITVKAIRRNSDNTLTVIDDIGVFNVNTGKNTIILNYHTNEDVRIGIYTSNARFAYANIGGFAGDITISGEATGTHTGSYGSTFNMFASFTITTTTTKIEKKLSEESYKQNFMQIFPAYTAIGDSLTAGFISINGVNMSSAAAAQTKNNWPGYLALRTGREFNNVAVGGSTTKDWRETHITTADTPTDCYMVRMGVNDNRNSLAVGSSSDIATDFVNNADSFYGNYDFLIRQIMEYNTDAKIFVFTLPAYEGEQAENYNEAIRYIATLYDHVHLIDIYDDYYDEYTTGFIAKNFIGGHLSPMAYNYESMLIEQSVNQYIFDNYEDFLTVPYA